MMLLQPLVLRTGRGRLRPIWAAAHSIAILVVHAWVGRTIAGREVYLKGGFGFGEPIYGVSDVDMIIVLAIDPAHPGANRETARRRWKRLCRLLPPLGKLFQVFFYEDAELHELEAHTYLTYGLGDARDDHNTRPAFLGTRPPQDDVRLLDRPGLYGPRRDWRSLRSARRAPKPVADTVRDTILAWLELRVVWGLAFVTTVNPDAASAAYTCQKLVADSARIWLRLRSGEQLFRREEVLARAVERMPEEEKALRGTIELGRRLPRRPEPPLADVLPFLVRMSERIADHLAVVTSDAGSTQVELTWGAERELLVPEVERSSVAALSNFGLAPQLLPLADWRACAIPALLDEAFAVVPGDPGEPARLAQLAGAKETGVFAVLRAGEVLVAPNTAVGERGRLRGVQCATSDPVSHALAAGATKASFPDVAGWSASDWARRAVAEQRAHLELGRDGRLAELPPWVDVPPNYALAELSALLSAARAAHFAESLEAGQPELPVTVAAIPVCLAEHGQHARMVAECAHDAIRAARLEQRAPDARVVSALRKVVEGLPAYRGGSNRQPLATPPLSTRSPRPS